MMMLKDNVRLNRNSQRLLLFFAFMTCGGILSAQEKFEQIVKSQMVQDWQRARTYTDSFLHSMPANKYSFRPNETFMSFAEQMLHLAKYNYKLVGAATGAASPYGKVDIQENAATLSKDSIISIVDASYAFVISNLQKIDAEKLRENSGGMTRFLLLEKAFEHQTHHRGSMAVYLRLAGVIPPHEMLF